MYHYQHNTRLDNHWNHFFHHLSSPAASELIAERKSPLQKVHESKKCCRKNRERAAQTEKKEREKRDRAVSSMNFTSMRARTSWTTWPRVSVLSCALTRPTSWGNTSLSVSPVASRSRSRSRSLPRAVLCKARSSSPKERSPRGNDYSGERRLYGKNLQNAIKNSNSVNEILSIVAENESFLDHIHCVTAIYRMAKLTQSERRRNRGNKGGQQINLLNDDRFEVLKSSIESQINKFDSWVSLVRFFARGFDRDFYLD